jgi:hypothetical protein
MSKKAMLVGLAICENGRSTISFLPPESQATVPKSAIYATDIVERWLNPLCQM